MIKLHIHILKVAILGVCLLCHSLLQAGSEINDLNDAKKFSLAWEEMQKTHLDDLSLDELVLMGNYCKEGRKDVAIDRDQSRKIFTIVEKRIALAKNNDGKSLFFRGMSILNSSFDNTQAYKYIHAAADAGYSDAQAEIAIMLLKGIGVKTDTLLAMDYLKKAVAQNNLTAKAYLASYYLGQKKDIKSGIALAKESRDAGNRAGQYTIGMAYEKGISVTQDDKKALRLYQLSADQGLKDAGERLEWLKEKLNIPREQYIDEETMSNSDNK